MIATLTKVVLTDITSKALKSAEHDKHLKAAIAWLKRAHDSTDDGGVGYGYYLRGNPFSDFGFGWRASYVESSGYILETFYDIAAAYQDQDAAMRAENIGRWLISVQNNDGSFANKNTGSSDGIIFDTGQVLFGLLRCYKETGDIVFLDAAKKAVIWLIDRQSEDGAWRRNTHLGATHSYNSRVAWAILEYCKLRPNADYKAAARQNLNWVLSQQLNNGFFDNSAFKTGKAPFTHTIAYTIRGLYEGGILLGDETMVLAAYKSACTIQDYVGPKGFIPGQIDISGRAVNEYSCLTGNCQMMIIWYRMAKQFNDISMQQIADLALNYVLRVHDIETSNKNIRGGLKGSHPIWGDYAPLAYPNWAAKFLIDALMIKPM